MGFAKVSNFAKVENTQLSLFLPPSYFILCSFILHLLVLLAPSFV
ncbi:hypothetical protein HMPREF9072_01019 [Capnocytophaga sp. oral taxon 324 str. F0483]|nr:hypothetical protein HMPREF9072_01019 [Capnocytophaga sp. oral taxon 324 str. F0483]